MAEKVVHGLGRYLLQKGENGSKERDEDQPQSSPKETRVYGHPGRKGRRNTRGTGTEENNEALQGMREELHTAE